MLVDSQLQPANLGSEIVDLTSSVAQLYHQHLALPTQFLQITFKMQLLPPAMTPFLRKHDKAHSLEVSTSLETEAPSHSSHLLTVICCRTFSSCASTTDMPSCRHTRTSQDATVK